MSNSSSGGVFGSFLQVEFVCLFFWASRICTFSSFVGSGNLYENKYFLDEFIFVEMYLCEKCFPENVMTEDWCWSSVTPTILRCHRGLRVLKFRFTREPPCPRHSDKEGKENFLFKVPKGKVLSEVSTPSRILRTRFPIRL